MCRYLILLLHTSLLVLSFPTIARAASTNVVISQIYSGGGNTGTNYANDYIELFNAGNALADLTGWSIQHSFAGKHSWQKVDLNSVILQAGQYYLIELNAGIKGGHPLPTPDQRGKMSIAGMSGKVVLVNDQIALIGKNVLGTASIIDYVAYGREPIYVGNGAAPTLGDSIAVFRNDDGCANTDNNANDFSATSPAPRNTVTALNPCNAANTAPAVDRTIPAANATDVATDTPIQITFTEPVNVLAGWYAIGCTISSVGTAAVSGGTTTYTLTLDSTFIDGETCTVTIDASKVEDQQNEPMAVDYIWSFSIGSESPHVKSTVPANNAIDIPTGVHLVVTFSEAVRPSSDWFTINCTRSGRVSATTSGGPAQYILDPTSNLQAGEACTVTIVATQVKDTADNMMGLDYSWDFVVVAGGDDVPPYLVLSRPRHNASKVALDATISLIYNEDVSALADAYDLTCSESGPVTFNLTGGPNSFVLDPTVGFVGGEICVVRVIATKVNDLDGTQDNMAADHYWLFTTFDPDADIAPIVTDTTPTNNANDVAVGANLSVNFSENVMVGDTSLTIICDKSGAHTVITSGGPANYVFNPNTDFNNGESCTATIIADQVKDQDGTAHSLEENYVWSFNTLDVAPSITTTIPADADMDVALNANLSVTFSEDVTVSPNAFILNCTTSGGHVLIVHGGPVIYVLDPIVDFAPTETCTARVVGANVRDQDGQEVKRISDDMVWTFTTVDNAADTPPSVVNTNPANGATGVAVDANISLSFSEDVANPTNAFVLNCNTTGNLTLALTGGPQDFVLDPTENLGANDTCSMTVLASKIHDLGPAQKGMTNNYVWAFSTAPADPSTIPPFVDSTLPDNHATHIPVTTDLSVNFSEDVTARGDWFTINCSRSGLIAAQVTGGPQSYTLNPDQDFQHDETCTVTLIAVQIVDLDDQTHPMDEDYAWSFSTATDIGLCDTAYLPIFTLANGDVITQGVVTADFEGDTPDTLGGFTLQDLTGDADPLTSDGVFVSNPGVDVVNAGDVVRVAGNYGGGQISGDVTVVNCGQTTQTTPLPLILPLINSHQLDRYEGMLVSFAQSLTVTQNYWLGRDGQVTLSANGRLMQPTNVTTSGQSAQNLLQANRLNQIILDDSSTAIFPDPTPFLLDGTLRVGDTITGLTGVVLDGRIQPAAVPTITRSNPRPSLPANPGGTLRVASFNVLNYFNGPNYPTSRGADTPEEFARQRDKIITALLALDADVIGLMEIENDGYGPDSALQDLVKGLNTATAPGTYAFVTPDFGLGNDAIKVAFVYRPAFVMPLSTPATTTDAPFNRRRPSLAQTFQQISNKEAVTVVVNHFKSKGCSGNSSENGDQGDGQGCYNKERTEAATTLANWLANDPTGTGEQDILIIGDINAYALEDPLQVFAKAGYTNLIPLFEGTSSYSYVFAGQSGSLDHALANAALLPQITGVTTWHINADEPTILDYNLEDKSPAQQSLNTRTPFASSDHDPIIIGLNLQPQITYAPVLRLIAPPRTVTDHDGYLSLVWSRLLDATEYQVYLAHTDFSSQPVLYDVFEDSDFCHANATCSSVMPILPEGSYTVYLRAWLKGIPGRWEGPFYFTLQADPPTPVLLGEVTDLQRSRVRFHWQLDDTADYASWFRVYVAPQVDSLNGLIDRWLPKTEVCVDRICSLQSDVDMVNGIYNLFIQSWGAGGTSTGGIEGSGFVRRDFTIAADTPTPPNGLTISTNQGQPTLTWPDDVHSSWYEVYVGYSDGSNIRYQKWYHNTADLCDSAVCQLTPDIILPNANYDAAVRGWGPAGLGKWTNLANFKLDFLPPAAVTPLTVTHLNRGSPTFSWKGVKGATYYQLWIGTSDFKTQHLQWYVAADLGCAAPEVCRSTPQIYLPNDSYVWYVRAAGPGGTSPDWSAGMGFLMAAPPAGLPEPGTPNRTIGTDTPTFIWQHVDGTTWYQIRIERTAGEKVYQGWFNTSQLVCSTSCTLHIPKLSLNRGDYVWSLQAYTPAGIGRWSSEQSFTVDR